MNEQVKSMTREELIKKVKELRIEQVKGAQNKYIETHYYDPSIFTTSELQEIYVHLINRRMET